MPTTYAAFQFQRPEYFVGPCETVCVCTCLATQAGAQVAARPSTVLALDQQQQQQQQQALLLQQQLLQRQAAAAAAAAPAGSGAAPASAASASAPAAVAVAGPGPRAAGQGGVPADTDDTTTRAVLAAALQMVAGSRGTAAVQLRALPAFFDPLELLERDAGVAGQGAGGVSAYQAEVLQKTIRCVR